MDSEANCATACFRVDAGRCGIATASELQPRRLQLPQ